MNSCHLIPETAYRDLNYNTMDQPNQLTLTQIVMSKVYTRIEISLHLIRIWESKYWTRETPEERNLHFSSAK